MGLEINEFFYFVVCGGWLLSASLLIASYLKYKIFTFFDVAVVMSWFFVFFRPLNIYSCDIKIDLYYWDEQLYVLGALISIVGILVFQSFGLLASRRHLHFEFDLAFFKRGVNRISFFVFICCCFVVLLMFLNFGEKVFPSNRGEGALSVSMPGLEIYYHIIRALTLVLMVMSLVSFLMFRAGVSLFYAVFSVAVLIIFAKRNAIIYPIAYSVFLYSAYYVYFLGKSFYSLVVKLVPMFLFLVFIAFFGKSFKSQDSFAFEAPADGYSCQAVRLGMQEFDLFWPAVLEVGDDRVNAADLPGAVWGALAYDHASRVESTNLSITDKTMLEYNYENYVYRKFGISPSIYQFYYYYFWWWGFCVLAAIAYLVRRFDFGLVRSFYCLRFGMFLFLLSFSKLLLSPFDFTIKYTVFEMVVFLMLYFFVVMCSNITRLMGRQLV